MNKRKMVAMAAVLLSAVACVPLERGQPKPGTLETMAELEINPGNVAVTRQGKMFASVHQFRPAEARLIEITGAHDYRPFPDAEWNDVCGDPARRLIAPLGVQVDERNWLWVIDNGNTPAGWQQARARCGEERSGRAAGPFAPKLLAFDLATGEVMFRYQFPAHAGPKGSFLQDIAVDARRGVVYVADAGGKHRPALVVVDTTRKTSRRISGLAQLAAEDVDMVVEGKVVRMPGAKGMAPARIGVNPITLSGDGEMLYFGAMNGEAWYGVPTRVLRGKASLAAIRRAVRRVGTKPVSDGAATDDAGNHYFTAVNRNAIEVLTARGERKTLAQFPLLNWPDNLSFGEPGWVYMAVNQLHRAPIFNQGIDMGRPPYRIMRMRVAE